MKTLQILAIAALTAGLAAVQAHGDDAHAHAPAHAHAHPAGKAGPTPFGQAGDPKLATRTITVEMSDDMRFTPSALSVRKGETVRFVVHNRGQVLHEMVLGTKESIAAHAAQMKQSPGMAHDDANMVHVEPGRRGEIVWQFTQAGEFPIACLLPGHFEAGMVGAVTVQ